MKKVVIGIDIGGSHFGIGLVSVDSGELLSHVQNPHSISTPSILVSDISRVAHALLASNLKCYSLFGIGVACPGQTKDGILIAASNFPGCTMVPLADLISEQFNNVPVVLLNDADAALAAEVWGMNNLSALKNADSDLSGTVNVAMITLGTGIGVSLFLNGSIHTGSHNLIEAGHSIISLKDGRRCGCGQTGCVEAYASALSTARRMWESDQMAVNGTRSATENGSGDGTGRNNEFTLEELMTMSAEVFADGRHNAKDVFDRAAAGDPLAEEVLEETAECLSLLCINICRMVDPDIIVIGGGMARADSALLDRVRRHMARRVWTVLPHYARLVLSATPEHAGIIGAALAVRQAMVSTVTSSSSSLSSPSPMLSSSLSLSVPGERHLNRHRSPSVVYVSALTVAMVCTVSLTSLFLQENNTPSSSSSLSSSFSFSALKELLLLRTELLSVQAMRTNAFVMGAHLCLCVISPR
eukprot:gene6422-12984_t